MSDLNKARPTRLKETGEMEHFTLPCCPSCGKEMKKGFIQSGTRLAWVPKVTRLTVEPSFNQDAVLLSKQSRLSINYVDAYLCESCQKVLVDYGQQGD